jgi:hypothetical protein
MDEVPTQPIDGLVVSTGGIDFTFSDPQGNLLYDASSVGSTTYIQDPSIAGNNESFGVSFSVPVDSIQFGLLETNFAPLTGVTVDLFSGVTALPPVSFDLPLADPFAEGQFNWAGGPVTSIVVIPIGGPPSLAFDNLTVDPVAATPEPESLQLLESACAGILILRFLKKRSPSRFRGLL